MASVGPLKEQEMLQQKGEEKLRPIQSQEESRASQRLKRPHKSKARVEGPGTKQRKGEGSPK